MAVRTPTWLVHLGVRRGVQLVALAGAAAAIFALGMIAQMGATETTRRDLERRLALANLTAARLDARLTQALQLLSAAATDLSDAAGSQLHLASLEPARHAALGSRLRAHQLRLNVYGRRLFWIDAHGTVLWCEPREAGLLAQPFPDFPAVSAPLRDNAPLVSNLSQSPASVQPYVLMAVPVAPPDGAALSLLIEEVSADQLELGAILGRVPGGDGASIQVIDGAGVILASTQPGERFQPVCPAPAGADRPADHPADSTGALPAACRCHSCYTGDGEVPGDAGHSLAAASLQRAPWHVIIAPAAEELGWAAGPTWYWALAGIGLITLALFLGTGWSLPGRLGRRLNQNFPAPAHPTTSDTSDSLQAREQAADTNPPMIRPAQLRGPVGSSQEDQRHNREALQWMTEAHTMELTALYEQLEERKEMCKRLLGRVLTAQEEERARLARELHDCIGQSLTAIIMTAAAVQDSLPEAFTSGREKLAGVRSIAVQALHDLRGLIFDLRPEILDDLGLALALRSQIKQSLEPVGVRAQLRTIGLKEHLPRGVEITIFRVVQEAITNIARHAQATEATISLTRRDNRLIVRVEDNGVGFDVNLINNGSQHAWGLRGMEERVTLLGGEIYISSKPGQGTLIHAEVPLDAC